MFCEVYTITHSDVDEDDLRGDGNFHEQEYAADGSGSRKLGSRYFRRLDQALAYLQPTMFVGKGDKIGQPKEDDNHKPLVGVVTKLQVEFSDDDFEPQPLSGKPIHKRGFTWIDENKTKLVAPNADGLRIIEVRKYVAESVAIGTTIETKEGEMIQVNDASEVFQAKQYRLVRVDQAKK